MSDEAENPGPATTEAPVVSVPPTDTDMRQILDDAEREHARKFLTAVANMITHGRAHGDISDAVIDAAVDELLSRTKGE